jgi:hypothetical protein
MGALGLAVLVSGSLWSADNELTPKEKTSGWKLLFDGSTYAGWEDPTRKSPPGDSFTIEDGCLKTAPHARIEEDLFTRETFTNFELVFDWKIAPGGNSGVKYRIQDRAFLLDATGPGTKFEDRANASFRNKRTDRPAKGQEYVVGFEYQMLDNQKNADALRGTSHQTGALYDMFPPAKDAARPVGEFNHSRLVVKGDHVEHWLNGEKVVEFETADVAVRKAMADAAGNGPLAAERFLSLQNHGTPVWFRGLKARRLASEVSSSR